jgi:hypothetical protein
MELILNKKSYVSSSCVLDLKKTVLNLLDRTMYVMLINWIFYIHFGSLGRL